MHDLNKEGFYEQPSAEPNQMISRNDMPYKMRYVYDGFKIIVINIGLGSA